MGTTLYAVSVGLVFGLFVTVVREDIVDHVLTHYTPVFVAAVLASGFWITVAALEFVMGRKDA